MSSDEYRSFHGVRGFALPRWLLVSAGALVILIVGGAVFLKLAFPPEKLRALVVPQIERRVGRDVELASVRLQILPRIAVRLDQLSIANPPGFESEPMIELDALELDLRFWPLLRREFEFGQVRMVRPIIRYVVLEDGSSNFQGLGPADPLEARAIPASLTSFAVAGLFLLQESGLTSAFFVSDLRIDDGALHYSDHSSGRSASMALQARASIDRATVGDNTMESRGTIDLSSIALRSPELGQDSVRLADTKVDYEVFADLPGDSVTVRDLRLTVGDLPLKGAGAVYHPFDERELELDLFAEDVDVANLISSLPDSLRARLGDIDASGIAQLSLSLSSVAASAGAQVNGMMSLREIDVTYGEYGQVVTGGSGELTFDPGALTLSDFEGQSMGRPFRLRLALRDFDDVQAEGQVTGVLDLAQLAALLEFEVPLVGEAAVDLTFQGPTKQLGAVRVTGPIELRDVVYRSESLAVPAVVSSATIQLTGNGIVTEAVPVQFGTSDLTLAFDAPGSLPYLLSGGEIGSLPTVEFTLTSSKLDMSELSVESEAVGYGDLVSARLSGGQIDGRDPVEVAGTTMLLPPIPPINSRGDVRIAAFINPPNRVNDLAFQLQVQNGVLSLSDLRGRAYGGTLSGRLGLDFSDGAPPFPLTYDLGLQDANAAGVLRRWTRLGAPISGRLDLEMNGRVIIDGTMLPSPDGVRAVGDIAFRQGRFEQFALTDALARQLRIDTSQLADFRDFGGRFEIRDGNFLVQDWEVISGDYTGTIVGAAGLGGSLDLALELEVPIATLHAAGLGQGTPFAALLGQLAGTDEALDVSVAIGGTMSSPALLVDQQALQAQVGRLLQGQGGDLLNRLLQQRRDTTQVNH